MNPDWPVTATVHDAVLDPSMGTNVDSLTWKVLSAAEGARCVLYLTFSKNGSLNGNATVGPIIYHKGASNTDVAQLAPDQHDETADYTLACALNGGAKHWATPGTITVE